MHFFSKWNLDLLGKIKLHSVVSQDRDRWLVEDFSINGMFGSVVTV